MQKFPRPKGVTIAVVGIDGSGKTTFVSRLRDALVAAGHTVRSMDWFRDPQFRELATCFNKTDTMTPEVLAALHAASTLSQLQQLKESKEDVILWDRYVYSSYASAGVRGASDELLRAIIARFPGPDLTIHLVADPREAFQRIRNRGGTTYYESGLDRLFRGRASVMQLEFEAGQLSESLTEEIFVSTMDEWNKRLEQIVPVGSCLRLDDFDLRDSADVCRQVIARLALAG